jgi:hypothetical protein
MNSVDIYRGAEKLITVKPEKTSAQTKIVMGDNVVQLTFLLNVAVDFRLSDWCTIFGEEYHLNKTPDVQKLSTLDFKYNLTFQAEGFDISKVYFLGLGPDNELTQPFFSFVGDASQYMELLLMNIDRIYSGFSIGEVIPTAAKHLDFNAENCYNVLSRLAEEFETEFWIEGKVLHLTKRSTDTSITLKYGSGKGLYDISRKDLGNALATRLWAVGAERNLPADYRGFEKRLLLPDFQPGIISNLNIVATASGVSNTEFSFTYDPPNISGLTWVKVAYRLQGSDTWAYKNIPPAGTGSTQFVIAPNGTYEMRFITITSSLELSTETIIVTGTSGPFFTEAPRYIERNVDLHGIIEHTQIFDDVYPHRTGKVTAVDATNEFVFTDAALDFNVADYFLPGKEPKIVFLSGELSNYQFKIYAYDNAIKKFTILKNEEERNLTVPSPTLKPSIGDTYTIIDIKMPQSYIDAAEEELLNRAEQFLNEASEPQLQYVVNIDSVVIRKKNLTLAIGQLVWLIDAQLGVNKKIRITRTVRNLVEETKYVIDLSDIVPPANKIERSLSASASNSRGLTSVERGLQNNAILNGEVVGTLRFSSMPQTGTLTGFLPVYLEVATGKLFVKV